VKISEMVLPGMLLIEPGVFDDQRGFFLETWNRKNYLDTGFPDVDFVQDNHSRSARGVLRGLHFQREYPQGKLVQVMRGKVFDVSVDIRVGSPAFGRWSGFELSDANHRQLWIPPGFAHGFCVLSDTADFCYKCTDYYRPEDEAGVAWNDPKIGIKWPLQDVLLSDKDRRHPELSRIPADHLPVYPA